MKIKMTDATNNDDQPKNFSFRMFDLYRRFVEVLSLNQDFLEEFKSGKPREETCRTMIKSIFQHRQTEPQIIRMLRYLNTNAKTIANHADNIPFIWKDAIKYTDRCIKIVKKYLRSKGIDLKREIDSVNELAQEIGILLHSNPNEEQLEAIREYLKYDIRNPKRTIIPYSSSERSKKHKKSIKTIENFNHNDLLQVEIKTNNEPLKNTKDVKLQDLYTFDNGADLKKQLQKDITKSQNELSYIENTKSTKSVEELVSDVMKDNCLNNDEFIDVEYLSSQDENFLVNNENITKDNKNELSCTSKNLKRKHNNCNTPESTQKLFVLQDCDTQLDLQKDRYTIISSNKKNDILQNEKAKILITDTPQNKFAMQNIKEINDDLHIASFVDKNDHISNTVLENSKQELIAVLEGTTEVEQEKKLNSPLNSDQKSEMMDDSFCSDNYKENQNNILSMTYTEAFKLMEVIMAFCALKDEITLEEFLVLRRTRDKMHWRSLIEINQEDSLKSK